MVWGFIGFLRAHRVLHLGGCQNYGPFLGPYYNTAPIIQGTPKGTIILTTTHLRKYNVYASGGLGEAV